MRGHPACRCAFQPGPPLPCSLVAAQERAEKLQGRLEELMSPYGRTLGTGEGPDDDLSSHVDWPHTNLWVAEGRVERVDLDDSLQGLTLVR